jgi:hypothetical protein
MDPDMQKQVKFVKVRRDRAADLSIPSNSNPSALRTAQLLAMKVTLASVDRVSRSRCPVLVRQHAITEYY